MSNEPPFWSKIPLSGVPAEELLRTARMQLFMGDGGKKYFGRLGMRLQFIESYAIPTAAIDVKGRMYYNPYFINYCKLNDAIFVIAHETFHLVQRTFARFPVGGLHRFWNMASDIVNNQSLNECGIALRKEIQHQFPGYPEEHQKYNGEISEVIYYDLIKEAKDKTECAACKKIAEEILKEHQNRSMKDQKNQGEENDDTGGDEAEDGSSACNGKHSKEVSKHEHGERGDPCTCGQCGGQYGSSEGQNGNSKAGDTTNVSGGGDFPAHTCEYGGVCTSGVTSDQSQGTEPGDAEDWSKWQRGILSAAEGINRGDIPGTIRRVLEELVKPRITWKDIIRSSASNIFGKGRYNMKRPGRRSLATGVRLPARYPENLGALIWLDTSGSISREVHRQNVSECYGILKQTGCSKILVGCHDVNAYFLKEIGSREDLLAIPYRTGGTSHIDVFDVTDGNIGNEKIELPHGYKVGMVICFTDLCSEFPAKCKHSVIWAVPENLFDVAKRAVGQLVGYGGPKFGKQIKVEITQ
jgi:predicted metal-dependent peptidase